MAMLLDSYPSSVHTKLELSREDIKSHWDSCAKSTVASSLEPPKLPAQLTLVCPRHLCVDDSSSFLIGGIFLPNLDSLPATQSFNKSASRASGSAIPNLPNIVSIKPVGVETTAARGLTGNTILSKAAQIGELLDRLAPSVSLIDAAQKRDTPGSGGGLLPCPGFDLPASPTKSKGEVSGSTSAGLCQVKVLLGPENLVSKAIQIARNRWRVFVSLAEINPRAYLPVLEIYERGPATEKSLMSSYLQPEGLGVSGNFGQLQEKAFTIRTRPSQCWQVKLSPPTVADYHSDQEHSIQLELKCITDRLTQHQSNWLRSLFEDHADDGSMLLPLSQFRSFVVPKCKPFPMVIAVASTLVRQERSLEKSDFADIDAPQNPLEELFVRFCTSEQLSQVRLQATTDGSICISHVPINSPLAPPADAANGISKPWLVPRPSADAGVGAALDTQSLLSGLHTTLSSDGYHVREGVSMTGFLCFILYAFLGKKAMGGLDQSPIPYSASIDQLMPEGVREHTVWLNSVGIDTALATPRSERSPRKAPATPAATTDVNTSVTSPLNVAGKGKRLKIIPPEASPNVLIPSSYVPSSTEVIPYMKSATLRSNRRQESIAQFDMKPLDTIRSVGNRRPTNAASPMRMVAGRRDPLDDDTTRYAVPHMPPPRHNLPVSDILGQNQPHPIPEGVSFSMRLPQTNFYSDAPATRILLNEFTSEVMSGPMASLNRHNGIEEEGS
eukprot:GILI01015488.1.p1 GENE.GILI01015488.1~~GILI01015488.1.p1  ORF type:complete len:726 (+),score=30.90 GILI01015488.1:762-2939(+)